MVKGGPWSEEEIDALERWYPEYGTRCPRWECNGGELLHGRTKRAIAVKAERIGLRCRYQGPRIWTKAQDRAALEMLARVCRETGKSPYQVLGHLRSLVENNQRRARAAQAVHV